MNEANNNFSAVSFMEELSRLGNLISRFTAEVTSYAPKAGTVIDTLNNSRGRKDEESATNQMLGNFEAMLGFTGSMLEDMGLMDSGFGKMLQSLLQFVSSFSGGGDIISTIGGIFGSLIGLFTGPAGMAAGAGSAMLNSQPGINAFASSQSPAKPVIVQNTIKNPVTFRRALEIETRIINNLNSVTAG